MNHQRQIGQMFFDNDSMMEIDDAADVLMPASQQETNLLFSNVDNTDSDSNNKPRLSILQTFDQYMQMELDLSLSGRSNEQLTINKSVDTLQNDISLNDESVQLTHNNSLNNIAFETNISTTFNTLSSESIDEEVLIIEEPDSTLVVNSMDNSIDSLCDNLVIDLDKIETKKNLIDISNVHCDKESTYSLASLEEVNISNDNMQVNMPTNLRSILEDSILNPVKSCTEPIATNILLDEIKTVSDTGTNSNDVTTIVKDCTENVNDTFLLEEIKKFSYSNDTFQGQMNLEDSLEFTPIVKLDQIQNRNVVMLTNKHETKLNSSNDTELNDSFPFVQDNRTIITADETTKYNDELYTNITIETKIFDIETAEENGNKSQELSTLAHNINISIDNVDDNIAVNTTFDTQFSINESEIVQERNETISYQINEENEDARQLTELSSPQLHSTIDNNVIKVEMNTSESNSAEQKVSETKKNQTSFNENYAVNTDFMNDSSNVNSDDVIVNSGNFEELENRVINEELRKNVKVENYCHNESIEVSNVEVNMLNVLQCSAKENICDKNPVRNSKNSLKEIYDVENLNDLINTKNLQLNNSKLSNLSNIDLETKLKKSPQCMCFKENRRPSIGNDDLLQNQIIDIKEKLKINKQENEKLKQIIVNLEKQNIENIAQSNIEVEQLREENGKLKEELVAAQQKTNSVGLATEKAVNRLYLELDEVTQEKCIIQRHLDNAEASFSDVHQKYESLKQTVTSLKRSDETLRKDLVINERIIERMEKRYASYKDYVTIQVEKFNADILATKKCHEAEISKLHAQLKRYDIKCNSLTNKLEQIMKENEEINAAYDELIGRVN